MLSLGGRQDSSSARTDNRLADSGSKQRDEMARTAVKVDPHSPPRFRVNGSLADLPEFGRAFSCPASRPMTPANACEVW